MNPVAVRLFCAAWMCSLLACTPALDAPATVPPTRTANQASEIEHIHTTPLTMTTASAAHTAPLPDGTVLITGGFADGENALASAERFDPATRAFLPVAPMGAARQLHTATTLPDGTVLLAGGLDGDDLDSAEIYDPATGAFRATGSMAQPRESHTATRLADGTVLVVGGYQGDAAPWRFTQAPNATIPPAASLRLPG